MAIKTKKIRTALDVSNELENVRYQKAELDELDKRLTTELKTMLHDTQQKEAGNYKLSVARSLKVEDEKVAMLWATNNRCVKVDTSKAKEILRHTFEDPSKFGFSVQEKESVVPKGRKQVNEE